MNWGEMQERHFDKLLLSGLFFLLTGMAAFGQYDWAQRMGDTVLGSLLTIITGRAMQRASDGRNGNGAPKNGG